MADLKKNGKRQYVKKNIGDRAWDKFNKKRISILHVCKTITVISVFVSLAAAWYVIRRHEETIEMSQDYITILEGRNEECLNRYKELSERGTITIEFVEDIVK